MTSHIACVICATPRPTELAGNEPWCCSLACYASLRRSGQEATSPSCHQPVTTLCPACGRRFVPTGRQRYCSAACRPVVYRRARNSSAPPLSGPRAQPRRPITVYECADCGGKSPRGTVLRAVPHLPASRWRRGCCPTCDEPISVVELLDQQP